MPTLRVNGKSRKHGDVFVVAENDEQRFYVVAYNDEQDEMSFERISPEILRLLAPDKFDAALREIYPLRRVG